MDNPDIPSTSGIGSATRTVPQIEDTDRITPASNSDSTSGRPSLTVARKWKVEQELAQRQSQKDGPSRIVLIAKWIFTILLASAITVLFITVKISFLSLSLALNATRPLAGPTEDPESLDEWTAYTSQFLVIYLVIAGPYFILFVRAAWMGLFTKEDPWPCKSAVLCCLAMGVLEPLGLIILALKVLPNLSLYLGVIILSAVTTLPIITETLRSLRSLRRPVSMVEKSKMAINTAFVLGLLAVGLSLTVYMIYGQVKDSSHMTVNFVHVAGGLLCLNLAWLPRLLRYTRKTPADFEGQVDGNGSMADDELTSSETTHLSHSNTDTEKHRKTATDRKSSGPPTHKFKLKQAWKASFIIYGFKTLTTFIFSFLIFYVDSDFISTNFDHATHTAFLSAWSFASQKLVGYTWISFGVNLAGGLVCYVIAFIAAHTNMQRGCLAIPFMLSVPLTVLLTACNQICDVVVGDGAICKTDFTEWYFILFSTAAMTLAQLLSFWWNLVRKNKMHLLKEDQLFWIPGYNSAVIDSWLLLNSIQTTSEDQELPNDRSESKRTRVYICTTMYREDEHEMRQLLESLAKINPAQFERTTLFESHIIFDGGVRQRNLSEFSLVLISLLKETLGVLPMEGEKTITPYGMKLSWKPPTSGQKQYMTFNIHLKDNTLVKSKKRWSQIMYMSYVLDYLPSTDTQDEEVYILTTDADVMFTPGSVQALLDLMTRDPTIGAVCGRTHPMGSGPLVWYQIFEYAIGHWFHKAAEHVLGSVMCAPGCFSIYKCRALRDILPKYCKKVESSFDFLTKDMGEDRWLCTLMVQSGWRIEYCAVSENSTSCPSEFEEFFKQRRRWIVSTLANLMLIIREWKYIALFNHQISVVFLAYQALLLFSTLISPSMVALIVAGGLEFAWNINLIAAVILQIIVCVLFAGACILTAPKTHLFIAKIYTFLYAAVMCAVAVGTAEQVVTDLTDDSEVPAWNKSLMSTHKPPAQHVSPDVPISMTTIYAGFLASIFTLAGILHPMEITCLIHGICFLLCLPSAYLVLIIYSICNLTDSSWGTREAETVHSTSKKASWSEYYKKAFYTVFFCLKPRSDPVRGVDAETQTVAHHISRLPRLSSKEASRDYLQEPLLGDERQAVVDNLTIGEEQTQEDLIDHWFEMKDVPIPVNTWLHTHFGSQYNEIFKKHGYDSTLFIKNLTEADLRRMGVKQKGHVQFLAAEISRLPAFEIDYGVPTNVEDWLQEIGLAEYRDNFHRNHIQTPKEMEILKRFDRKEIEKELGISKDGHVKRLLEAIQKLRDPSTSQKNTVKMRKVIENIPVKDLDAKEYEFWSQLLKQCLEPDLEAFSSDAEVKEKLVELRNSWLLNLAVVNALWLILIMTLATKGALTLLGANPMGLVFLVIFGFLFLVQFLAMLVHRMATLCHYIARAPYTFGQPFLASWCFKDKVDDPKNAKTQKAPETSKEAEEAPQTSKEAEEAPQTSKEAEEAPQTSKEAEEDQTRIVGVEASKVSVRSKKSKSSISRQIQEKIPLLPKQNYIRLQ